MDHGTATTSPTGAAGDRPGDEVPPLDARDPPVVNDRLEVAPSSVSCFDSNKDICSDHHQQLDQEGEPEHTQLHPPVTAGAGTPSVPSTPNNEVQNLSADVADDSQYQGSDSCNDGRDPTGASGTTEAGGGETAPTTAGSATNASGSSLPSATNSRLMSKLHSVTKAGQRQHHGANSATAKLAEGQHTSLASLLGVSNKRGPAGGKDGANSKGGKVMGRPWSMVVKDPSLAASQSGTATPPTAQLSAGVEAGSDAGATTAGGPSIASGGAPGVTGNTAVRRTPPYPGTGATRSGSTDEPTLDEAALQARKMKDEAAAATTATHQAPSVYPALKPPPNRPVGQPGPTGYGSLPCQNTGATNALAAASGTVSVVRVGEIFKQRERGAAVSNAAVEGGGMTGGSFNAARPALTGQMSGPALIGGQMGYLGPGSFGGGAFGLGGISDNREVEGSRWGRRQGRMAAAAAAIGGLKQQNREEFKHERQLGNNRGIGQLAVDVGLTPNDATFGFARGGQFTAPATWTPFPAAPPGILMNASGGMGVPNSINLEAHPTTSRGEGVHSSLPAQEQPSLLGRTPTGLTGSSSEERLAGIASNGSFGQVPRRHLSGGGDRTQQQQQRPARGPPSALRRDSLEGVASGTAGRSIAGVQSTNGGEGPDMRTLGDQSPLDKTKEHGPAPPVALAIWKYQRTGREPSDASKRQQSDVSWRSTDERNSLQPSAPVGQPIPTSPSAAFPPSPNNTCPPSPRNLTGAPVPPLSQQLNSQRQVSRQPLPPSSSTNSFRSVTQVPQKGGPQTRPQRSQQPAATAPPRGGPPPSADHESPTEFQSDTNAPEAAATNVRARKRIGNLAAAVSSWISPASGPNRSGARTGNGTSLLPGPQSNYYDQSLHHLQAGHPAPSRNQFSNLPGPAPQQLPPNPLENRISNDEQTAPQLNATAPPAANPVLHPGLPGPSYHQSLSIHGPRSFNAGNGAIPAGTRGDAYGGQRRSQAGANSLNNHSADGNSRRGILGGSNREDPLYQNGGHSKNFFTRAVANTSTAEDQGQQHGDPPTSATPPSEGGVQPQSRQSPDTTLPNFVVGPAGPYANSVPRLPDGTEGLLSAAGNCHVPVPFNRQQLIDRYPDELGIDPSPSNNATHRQSENLEASLDANASFGMMAGRVRASIGNQGISSSSIPEPLSFAQQRQNNHLVAHHQSIAFDGTPDYSAEAFRHEQLRQLSMGPRPCNVDHLQAQHYPKQSVPDNYAHLNRSSNGNNAAINSPPNRRFPLQAQQQQSQASHHQQLRQVHPGSPHPQGPSSQCDGNTGFSGNRNTHGVPATAPQLMPPPGQNFQNDGSTNNGLFPPAHAYVHSQPAAFPFSQGTSSLLLQPPPVHPAYSQAAAGDCLLPSGRMEPSCCGATSDFEWTQERLVTDPRAYLQNGNADATGGYLQGTLPRDPTGNSRMGPPGVHTTQQGLQQQQPGSLIRNASSGSAISTGYPDGFESMGMASPPGTGMPTPSTSYGGGWLDDRLPVRVHPSLSSNPASAEGAPQPPRGVPLMHTPSSHLSGPGSQPLPHETSDSLTHSMDHPPSHVNHQGGNPSRPVAVGHRPGTAATGRAMMAAAMGNNFPANVRSAGGTSLTPPLHHQHSNHHLADGRQHNANVVMSQPTAARYHQGGASAAQGHSFQAPAAVEAHQRIQ